MLLIGVDMDGVLVDMYGGIIKHFAPDKMHRLKDWPLGLDDVASVIGWDAETLWTSIDKLGADFWANMPEYSWSHRLWDMCNKYGDTYILSSPRAESADTCAAGKIRWLQKFTGDKKFRKFILTNAKFACAKPGSVLIDDWNKQCLSFTEAGGRAILFPQRWNGFAMSDEERLQTVEAHLKEAANANS
jgi:5'(3')-deoxyribonucleotidase